VIAASWAKSIDGGALLQALLPTLGRIFAGFGRAVIVAVPVGLLMGSIRWSTGCSRPITEFIRPIPSSAYIPVAILFLGIDNEIEGCSSFSSLPVSDPAQYSRGRARRRSGADRHRPHLRGLALEGAVADRGCQRRLPSILTGMRISLGIALIVAVVAEMIAGNRAASAISSSTCSASSACPRCSPASSPSASSALRSISSSSSSRAGCCIGAGTGAEA